MNRVPGLARVAPLLTVALLTGCGRGRPTYQLAVGDTTFDLPVHEDAKRIQDEMKKCAFPPSPQ